MTDTDESVPVREMIQRLDLDAIEARRAKAMQMVRDLCEGRRDWIMRIPAEPDYDPDLVIAASLADVQTLVRLLKARASNGER